MSGDLIELLLGEKFVLQSNLRKTSGYLSLMAFYTHAVVVCSTRTLFDWVF